MWCFVSMNKGLDERLLDGVSCYVGLESVETYDKVLVKKLHIFV